MKFLVLFIVVSIILILTFKYNSNSINQSKVVNFPPDTAISGVLTKEDWEKFKNKTTEVIKLTKKEIEEKLRKDPEIKCVTEISISNGQYYLNIYGWNHGKIVYSKLIDGDFKKIKNIKLEEIRKCEEIIYSNTLKELEDLK
jgi:hypothetical protein